MDETKKTLLAAVLDTIIPPSADGRMPGAGELLGDAFAQRAELAPLLDAGLDALEPGFAQLPADARRAALEATAALAPAFLPTLVAQGFVAYYQDPRVREGLGLEARPPFPRGYELEAGDLSILDPVRQRDPIYREP